MPLPPDGSTDDASVRLPAHSTTVAAEDLRVRLVLACDTAGEIAIDASAVADIGQAVLQLLIAARGEARRSGQPFAIVNPSSAFVDRVNACRLGDAIGLEASQGDRP